MGNKKENHEALKHEFLERKKKMWLELREDCFRELGSEYSEQFSNPQDIEDLSVLDLIEDTGLKVAEVRIKELTQIQEALGKIEGGTYGLCDGCGAEIEKARLAILPHATHCVKCAAEKEEEVKP